ncbi:MAG: hypothetical protein L7V86_18015 [Verrucomicrobiales bacterium]|nr:hypothetical protein [Verrucomicrobiales bacterium]
MRTNLRPPSKGKSWALWLAFAFLLSASLSAFAAPIEVNNASFEQPPLGGGGNTWTNNIVDPSLAADQAQWVGTETGDKFIELIGGFQSEGTQHIGTAGGFYMTQNLGIPFEANTAYTLTVGVGYRNPNQSGAEAFTVIGLTATEQDPSDTNPLAGTDTNNQLEIDSLLESAHARVESVSLNDSVQKSFTDVTVEFITDDDPPSGNILIFLGDDNAGGRSHFDNVRLESLTALDPDGDKIPADWETGTDRGVARGLDPDVDDGGEDPDGDTITNFQEFELGTHPQLADTDGDGLNDNVDTEAEGLDPLNPDVDGDTLLDGAEIATHRTDPKNRDTDGDRFEDQAEVAAGTDPLLADSKPARGGAILLGGNFIGGTADSAGAMVTASAGVSPQENWNNFANGSGGPTIANNAEGEPSLLRVSWQTNGPAIAGDEPAAGDGNAQLMYGNLFPRGEDEGGDNVATEITVSNIAYPLYDLYLYLSSDEGGGTFTINEELYTVDEITPFGGTFVEVAGGVGNYLHLKNLEGDTLTIVGRQLGGGGAIGGFQIERLEPGDPSLLPIPERVDFGVFDGNPGPQEITVRMLNPGAANTLNVSNTTISGDQAANFTVSAIPDVLASGEEIAVTVTFNPSDDVGIYRGFLEITSNDVVQATSRIPLIGQIKNANGLVAHYKMDETDGTVLEDSSGNGFNGNYVAGSGSVTLGAESLVGTGTGVALVEGDDAAYAEIPSDVGLPTLAIGSYSFWVKQDPADVGTASVLFSRSTSPANPYAVFFESSGDSDSVTWTSEATSETLISDGFLNPDEVYHVVYTYADADEDGAADVEIYVNGVLNASEENASGYPINTVAPFQIGATAGLFGLTGVIDDFQIYEVALSAEQIEGMYAEPGSRAIPPPPAGQATPIAYWNLNEGQGTEVAEATNAALNGVVNGGTWVGGHTGAAGDNAVELTGEAGGGSNVELPALNETFTEITVTGWVNGVPTDDWTGLIQSRDGVQPIGMGFRAGSGELTYTWNDNNANTYNFVSGLAVPANEWTFIALTVTPDQGKLYVGAGGTLDSAVNEIEHLEQGSPTVWYLGKDACCGDNRNFEGAIDDVTVYNRALTDEQIQAIFEGLKEGVDVVVNGSFEEPAVDNINQNNLGVVPTGWSQTGDPATWNVIRNDGTPYDNGVNTAADGSQVLDLNGVFEIFQNFTLTEASNVTFGASFANRSGHDGADPSTVGIYDAAGESLLSPEVVVDTSGEPQPSEVWSTGEAVATNLPAGNYQIRIALHNWNNMDNVYAIASPATGDPNPNPNPDERPSTIGEVVLGDGDTTNINFSSEPGVEYDVEHSTDLIEWTVVDSVTADSASTSISVANDGPVAFYRVVKK